MKETVAIRVELSKDVHRGVRVASVEDGVPMAKVVGDALKAYLVKRRGSKGKVR